jgi:hypothetical protein
MINFPGIPNATVYGRAKGAPKTPPQRPVKATIYKHATGLNATVYRRATDTSKMPPQHPVNATVYMPNFTNEKINTYQ